MARRLTLLRDETIAETAGRITPEALHRIIERERDSMIDHLERLKIGPTCRGKRARSVNGGGRRVSTAKSQLF